MAKVHISREGFIGKSTLPNISRPGPDVSYNLSGLLNANQTTNNVSNTEIVDSSSYGYYISNIAGFPSQTQITPFAAGTGGSLFLDGSGDWLQVSGTNTPLAMSTGDFTIETWFFIPSMTNNTGNTIIDWRNAANQVAPTLYVFRDSGGITTVRYLVSAADRITSSTITLNAWNHVAVVRISGTTRMYLNGVQTGSNYTDGNNYITNADRPVIGVDSPSPTNFLTTSAFRGSISNVRVVKGIGVYTGTFTVPTSPLTATQSAGTNIAAISGTETSLLLNFNNPRVVDSSTNNVKGLAPSSLTWAPIGGQTRFNPYSGGGTYGSYWFDGTYTFIDSPASADFGLGSGDFTVEAWVYRQNNSAHVVCGTWNSGVTANSGFIFSVNSSNQIQLTYLIGSTQTNFTGTTTVPANQWNHVAAVRSGSNLRLYLNGVLASTVGTISGAINTPATAPLRIGGYQETTVVTNGTLGLGVQYPSSVMNGYITGIRIVKGTAVYTGTFTPPSIQPVDVSGAASAASYPSTTNVDTTFASTQTVLLCKFERATIQDNDTLPNPVYAIRDITTSTTEKKFGAASLTYTTNRLNSCLYIPRPITNWGTGNWTFMCWAYIRNWNVNAAEVGNGLLTMGIANSGTSANNVWRLWLRGNGVLQVGRYGIGDTNLGSITPASYTNTWFHVAFIRNSGTVTAYINGTSTGTASLSGTTGNAGGCLIGGFYNSGALDSTYPIQFLDGYLDDVVIASSALYTSNFTPPTTQATDPYIAPSTTTNNIYGLIQNY